MIKLNAEVRDLVKRVDKMDEQNSDTQQIIVRLETFIEISEKQRKLT